MYFEKIAIKNFGLLILFCTGFFYTGCKRDKPGNFDMLPVHYARLSEKAQIASKLDGFYNADSVFYELSETDSFQYCLNCYSAASLKKYKGGFWLYSRQCAPNTWENSRFSDANALSTFNDTIHMFDTIRANVVKGNTIWVRVFDKKGGYRDRHHMVFLGGWRPKADALISIYIDSLDFMGPNGFYGPGQGISTNQGHQWNYLLGLEKKCSYAVFAGKELELEAVQDAGIETKAFQSQFYPDKPLTLNANETTNPDKLLHLGKTLNNFLGNDIKTLRLRIGGPNHRKNILANEIALAIMEPEIGGEPSTPVCVFINGSFWTYAFAEEGLGRNHISKTLKTTPGQLVTAKILPPLSLADIKGIGANLALVNKPVYSICGFFNSCISVSMHNDTVAYEIDTSDTKHNPLAFEELYKVIKGGSDELLKSSINREAFYKYALSIWFFRNPVIWGGNVTAAKVANAPWTLLADHYDFNILDSPMDNDWDTYFTNIDMKPGDAGSKKSPVWLVIKRMLGCDRSYFCLVLEDELNTTYNTERTVAIAQQKISTLRPCVAECSKAWYPYGWQDSITWEHMVSNVVQFLNERTDGIAASIPRNFMLGNDTLWQLKDRRTVTISFDKIRGCGAKVKLNSLLLDSDFSGLYYPKPDLRIALQFDQKKYKFVGWLEYPRAAASFTLSADRPITLTPLLKLSSR